VLFSFANVVADFMSVCLLSLPVPTVYVLVGPVWVQACIRLSKYVSDRFMKH